MYEYKVTLDTRIILGALLHATLREYERMRRRDGETNAFGADKDGQ